MLSERPKIFISHSAQTNRAKQIRTALANALEKVGMDVFIAEDPERGVHPSDIWRKRIIEGLEYCDGAIVLLSKDVLDRRGNGPSPWVIHEVTYIDRHVKYRPHFPLLYVYVPPLFPEHDVCKSVFAQIHDITSFQGIVCPGSALWDPDEKDLLPEDIIKSFIDPTESTFIKFKNVCFDNVKLLKYPVNGLWSILEKLISTGQALKDGLEIYGLAPRSTENPHFLIRQMSLAILRGGEGYPRIRDCLDKWVGLLTDDEQLHVLKLWAPTWVSLDSVNRFLSSFQAGGSGNDPFLRFKPPIKFHERPGSGERGDFPTDAMKVLIHMFLSRAASTFPGNLEKILRWHCVHAHKAQESAENIIAWLRLQLSERRSNTTLSFAARYGVSFMGNPLPENTRDRFPPVAVFSRSAIVKDEEKFNRIRAALPNILIFVVDDIDGDDSSVGDFYCSEETRKALDNVFDSIFSTIDHCLPDDKHDQAYAEILNEGRICNELS